jgi:hypothetical protein
MTVPQLDVVVTQKGPGLSDGVIIVDGGEGLRLPQERAVKIDSNQPVGPHG